MEFFKFQTNCVKKIILNVLLETSGDAIMQIAQDELHRHEKERLERKAAAPKIVSKSEALSALAAFGLNDQCVS